MTKVSFAKLKGKVNNKIIPSYIERHHDSTDTKKSTESSERERKKEDTGSHSVTSKKIKGILFSIGSLFNNEPRIIQFCYCTFQ